MTNSETIWVDADACPKAVKEILYRAADRVGVTVILVANQSLDVPGSPHIQSVQVPMGFDIADSHIAQAAAPGDLVVTADIPLAAEVVAQGCMAINPRGELYTEENIRERLNIRDFMATLRSSGVQTGGPLPFGQSDRQSFANQLDRFLAGLDS